MQGPIGYTVVLDASVLVPGFLSNLLLWLAEMDLFQAKWSRDIHTEWIRNREKKYQISVEVSQARRLVMDKNFPHAIVTGYESLIDGLTLIDQKDRHVLAVAIKCGANAILTTNLKHFKPEVIGQYNIVAVHQDDFILDQIDLKSHTARNVALALIRHKKSMTKSRTSWKQYFQAMGRDGVGLKKTHAELTKPEFKALIADVLITEDWLSD